MTKEGAAIVPEESDGKANVRSNLRGISGVSLMMSCCPLLLVITLAIPGCAMANQQSASEPVGQGSNPQVVSDLNAVAERAIKAILANDIAFLSSVVDDAGIVLGTDGQTIAIQSFKGQLARRTGAYCHIVGCPNSEMSVRTLLQRNAPTRIVARTSPDFPDTGQVDVFAGGDAERQIAVAPIVSFYFTRRRGEWRLSQIEYI